MQTRITTHSAIETEHAGAAFASTFRTGGVVALEGVLGAGKTAFVKGMARGLGYSRVVQSPTFVLMKVYPVAHRGLRRIVHADCYRIRSSDEMRAIGIDDYLRDPKSLVIIEWADKMHDMLPAETVTVSITISGRSSRRIVMEKKKSAIVVRAPRR